MRNVLGFFLIGVMACAAWAQRPPIITREGDAHLTGPVKAGEGSMLDSYGPGIQAGADRLVATQCPSGGWNWTPEDCSATYQNLDGPIASGLLYAYGTTSDPYHKGAAVSAGNYAKQYQYPNNTNRFSSDYAAMFIRLANATGDPSWSNFAKVNYFDLLGNGTYGPNQNWDDAALIAEMIAYRGAYEVNILPWDFAEIPWAAGALGYATQQNTFRDALLASINALDNTDPNNVPWDMPGLTGAVWGLAQNGTTTFPAINAPKFSAIDGITTLSALANVLAGYQNADGSWNWSSNLPHPTAGDKDTQTTAYAVFALRAVGGYQQRIANASHWLTTMQLPNGSFYIAGNFPSDIYPEINAEALWAMQADGCTSNKLAFEATTPGCLKSGQTLTVELWQRNLSQPVRGYQVFAQFDSSKLTFQSAVFEPSPYGLVLTNTVQGNEITLAAGINDPNGQQPTQANAKLVTLTFTAKASIEGAVTISFRQHTPDSYFTSTEGQPITACLVESPRALIDNTPPVLTVPSAATVGCGQLSDPPATGLASATDNLDAHPTISFTDDRSGLTNCNATGTIVRTWQAVDCAGNTVTGTQNIIMVDNAPPVIVGCPAAPLTANNDPNLCSAVVTYPSITAFDMCYAEGFEDPQFLSGAADGIGQSVNWNNYNSRLTRVASGTNGITAADGGSYGMIDSTGLADCTTGIFTRMRGYSAAFGTGFVASVDVYLDVNDPAVTNDTYGWDVSTAYATPTLGYGRDFIFHVGGKLGGTTNRILIDASNNSTDCHRDAGYFTGNAGTVTQSGWYTFEWNFRNVGGLLAVDYTVYNSTGTPVWQLTQQTSDPIGTMVGGNRYMWFTFIDVPTLAIDNTTLRRNVDVIPSIPSGTAFDVGTTHVACHATDACGNPAATCGFDVIVTDTQLPTITGCPQDITMNADAGACTALVTWTPPTADDNCDILSFVSDYDPNTVFHQGTTTVTYTATDIHNNVSHCSFDVTVNAFNDLAVTLTLQPTVSSPLDRCITFELYDGTTHVGTVHQLLHFVNGTVSTIFDVPCDNYTCITARDTLHTLARTIPLVKVGTDWVASFEPNMPLIGGNLNDDGFIDILDFGIYSWQYGQVYHSNDCSTTYPNADISGNGYVDVADFTFLQVNFLKTADPGCVGGTLLDGGAITRISVEELRNRGLGDLAAGDWNHDGWLDTDDIAAFLNQQGHAMRGDMNCDGQVNFADINPFVLALSNPGAWQNQYPDCPQSNGDLNRDGRVDFGDINPFVELLNGR